MPLDPWRRAHDREVRAHAGAEFAAEGRTSYPRVWSEADWPALSPLPDAPDASARRRAAWAVVDARGRVLKAFPFARHPAAKRFAAKLAASVVRVKLPMADWE